MVFFCKLVENYKKDKYLKYLFETFHVDIKKSKKSEFDIIQDRKRNDYFNYFGKWWYIFYFIVETGVFGKEKECLQVDFYTALKYFVLKTNQI